MIYVTQGHQHGVGLEVFFKSLLCLPQKKCSQLHLIAYPDCIKSTLDTIGLNYNISSDSLEISNRKLKLSIPSEQYAQETQTTASLLSALNLITQNDILFTLPTSKDQLYLKGQQKNGYTEFLRDYYAQEELCMSFVSPSMAVALVSDHLPLSAVPTNLSSRLIEQKITFAIQTLQKFQKFSQVIISGINPHSGESGLMGKEDLQVEIAMTSLKSKFSDIEFKGPIPADTLYFSRNSNQLMVFMYHDQGLALFKSHNGLIGINITCGLPFIRASVDHGTAFDLYGKNSANYQGCLYSLNFLCDASY